MKLFRVSFLDSMNCGANHREEFNDNDKKWDIFKQSYETNYLSSKRISDGNIPKLVHQIWLGSQYPERYLKWQKSWNIFNPDWQYVLWDDQSIRNIKMFNEDIFRKTNNYGAKSDIARYEILYQYGGLYVDTDIECLKSFNILNSICDFYAGLYSSKEDTLNNALIGTIPRHPIIKECIRSIKCIDNSNDADTIFHSTGPKLFTEAFRAKNRSENKVNITFPVSFFFPFPARMRFSQRHVLKYIRPESYAIHYWHVSWQPPAGNKSKYYWRIVNRIPFKIKNKVLKYFGKPF